MPHEDITLRDIYDAIGDLRSEVASKYVTKDEFIPVKSIAYGLVSLIIVAVVTALIATVVKAGM